MSHKVRVSIGVVILAVFGTLAFLNFNKTVAPYVGFAEARAATGSVQVAGFPDHQAARFDPAQGVFLFDMINDQGDQMRVSLRGVKPGNFDQAEKVVVIGRYQEGAFHASQILVKCPSKYDDLAGEPMQNTAAPGGGS